MTAEDWLGFDADFLARLDRLELAVSRLRDGAGEGRLGRGAGGRVEFSGHRAYAAGDELRFVDWAAYARTRRLVVKEFDRDEQLDLTLVLDRSASMATGPSLRAAGRLVAALGRLALSRGDVVRVVTTGGDGAESLGRWSGVGRRQELLDGLRRLRPGGTSDLGSALSGLGGVRGRGRSVIVLSDLLTADDGRHVLADLRRSGTAVRVLRLRLAVPPELDGHETVIAVDAETGAERLLSGADVEAARTELARRDEDWRGFATRHRLVFVELDPTRSTAELVLGPLLSAGVVA